MTWFRTKIAKTCFAITSASALAVSGLGISSAMAASPAAAPASNIYGCVTGSSRTLEHVFTIEKNFDNFLAKNKGKCPNGFPFTVETNQTAPPTPTPTPTNSTPTPTPTNSTPTPTPTNTDAAKYTLTTLDHASTPNLPDPNIKGGDNDGGPSVRQEVWNPDPTALKKQVTEVWSASNWQTTENAVKGNTAVNSYPDVSDTVTDSNDNPVKASAYASMTSTYSESMQVNADTDGEAAYDIWLGSSEADQYSHELMIWVDNHGQTPAGNPVGDPVTIAGNTYQLWADSNDLISLVMTHNTPSGSVDILAIVNYLIAQGRYPADIGFNQVDFGFEVPSTGGVDSVFKVTDYSLKYAMK